jgi:hypothetical protein
VKAESVGVFQVTKSGRIVTEMDFRMPEFRDAKTEDYEFRDDGKIVRKDRWERGIRSVAFALGFGRQEWEIEDVVERARELSDVKEEWVVVGRIDWNDIPSPNRVDLRMEDGTVLRGVVHAGGSSLIWCGHTVRCEDVKAVRVI